MTAQTTNAPRNPFFHVPVLGWIARDMSRDFVGHFPYFLLIVLCTMVLAVKWWGLVALGLTAVMLTPVMMVLLIAITLGM